jgi:hypothetical protein
MFNAVKFWFNDAQLCLFSYTNGLGGNDDVYMMFLQIPFLCHRDTTEVVFTMSDDFAITVIGWYVGIVGKGAVARAFHPLIFVGSSFWLSINYYEFIQKILLRTFLCLEKVIRWKYHTTTSMGYFKKKPWIWVSSNLYPAPRVIRKKLEWF